MNDALPPCSQCARHGRVGSARCSFCGRASPAAALPASRLGRAAMMFGTLVIACGALTACGGGSEGDASEHRTEHQTTESHVTSGDESSNSGGHGDDPNASHDPEGADGVHDEAASQPHPDDASGASAPES